ncbi:MAG: aldo/keto reductase [Cardiobacteriaceae bacterium]|nr:aldo/keto reductase [Cardiobacteriaceae bacterium]
MNRREFIQNTAMAGSAILSSHTFAKENQAKNQGANQMKYIELNDGNKMPILGYGVYAIKPEEVQKCVEEAISVGYRSIDTAQAYFNEEGVGQAIKNSAVKREELFITTKLWISHVNETESLKAFDASMKKLGLDYLDLYLIHQPYNDLYGAWRTMSKLKKEGRIKSIGVSNFNSDRLVDFCINNEIKPAVNQIECHPFFQKIEEQKVLDEYGVAFESWAPFGEGRKDMFNNPVLKKIGEKYGKTVAQVILRWQIQRNIIVIPKTVKKERMIENFSVFDFELSNDDLTQIAALDDKNSLFFDHRDPEKVKWLNSFHRK